MSDPKHKWRRDQCDKCGVMKFRKGAGREFVYRSKRLGYVAVSAMPLCPPPDKAVRR